MNSRSTIARCLRRLSIRRLQTGVETLVVAAQAWFAAQHSFHRLPELAERVGFLSASRETEPHDEYASAGA